MTDYIGTNGNDTLTGTAADDRFYPKLGLDKIMGGGGNDVLFLDYTASKPPKGPTAEMIVDVAAGKLSGNYRQDLSNSEASFSGISSLNFVGSNYAENATVSAAALKLAAGALSLDGGGGVDTLGLDLSNVPGASFIVGSNGSVSSNVGQFSNWETYNISAGDGNYHVTTGDGADAITLGAGTSVIHAGGGNDAVQFNGTSGTVDGGTGTDLLTANYATSTTAIAFDERAGSLNKATVTGFEQFILTGGAADDSFRLDGASGSVNGGGGTHNLLAVDDSASAAGGVATVTIATGGTLSGNLAGISFSNIQDLTYQAGTGNDAITIANLNDALPRDIVLSGGAGDDTVTIQNASVFPGAAFALDGGTGNDRLVVMTSTSAFAPEVLVEHADGSVTSNLGSFANFETFSVTGAGGDDQLGGAGTFSGGAGDDILSGGAGTSADTLDGGDGIDTVSYAEAQAGVQVSLAKQGTAQNTVGAGMDLLTGFENLTGSSHDDVLTGDKHGNILDGGAGNDHLDGGGGLDTASYAEATAAVTVSLATTSAQNTGGAGTDTLINFANLIGSSYDDHLIGNASANLLDGRGGADTMEGGAGSDTYVVNDPGDVVIEAANAGTDTVETNLSHYTLGANVENLVYTGTGVFAGTGNALNNTIQGGGDDTLDGGDGINTVSYADAGGGVRVTLAITGPQDTLSAGYDTLSHFANALGSDYNDRLTGNADKNYLRGGAGDDVLSGGDGNDTLVGGVGADTLNGGAGADKFAYIDVSEFSPVSLGTGIPTETIGDFSHAEHDVIDLSRIDPDASLAGDQSFTFIGTATFTGTTGHNYEVREQRLSDGSYVVSGDIDHDGMADFALHVISSTALVASDFVL